MFQRSFFIFLYFFISCTAYGQAFKSINEEYGLSMREVVNVCQDQKGFIWSSTKTGVDRFDGRNFISYQLPFEHAGVATVKIFYNKELWAYTNDGQLFYYNRRNDHFVFLHNLRKYSMDEHFLVRKIILDKCGRFWIASSIGLYCLDGNVLTKSSDSRLINSQIGDVIQISSQFLLVSSPFGLFVINVNSKKISPVYEKSKRDEDIASIETLFYDSNLKTIWLGTLNRGLLYYKIDSKTMGSIRETIPQFPCQPIYTCETMADGSLLVGTDGDGIWKISTHNHQLITVYKENYDDPTSLKGNGVYNIFQDNDNHIWISTYSGGINLLETDKPNIKIIKHILNEQNSLGDNCVNGVIEDSHGDIWFATNNGLSRWNPQKHKWNKYYSNRVEHAKVFLSVQEDNNGNIWAGTFSSGVYVLDRQTGKEIAHYSDNKTKMSIGNNYIFSIYKDISGDIWMGGTMGKFSRFSNKSQVVDIFHYQPITRFIDRTPNELLLLCTYGLSSFDKKTKELSTLLPGYFINDISLEGDTVAWLATRGDGLIKYVFKSKKAISISINEGLPSNNVCSIIRDSSFLWLGTEKGICRYSIDQNTTDNISDYTSLSTLSANQHAVFRLSTSELIFGTNTGAILFNPKNIQIKKPKGKLYFQDFSILGASTVTDTAICLLQKSIDDIFDLSLKYSQHSFAFHFSHIGLNTFGLKYSWKLEGIDQNWIKPSSNKVANYTNIPPGDYVFKLKLVDSSFNEIDNREIRIHIHPPFWKTIWAQFLFVSFFVLLLYYILRYYLSIIQRRHSEEKMRFFTNTAHDIRTPLTLIKAPLEELKKEGNLSESGYYYLQIVSANVQKMISMVTQLIDFQKLDLNKNQIALSTFDVVRFLKDKRLLFIPMAKAKHIKLELTSTRDTLYIRFDISKFEKIIDNLLSNAIKYTQNEGRVEILLIVENNYWSVTIKDNGIGIPKEAQKHLFKEFYRGENAINSKIIGSGIGLLLVKDYVLLHKGKIEYNSKVGIGTDFKITFSLTKGKIINIENPVDSLFEGETMEYPIRVEAPTNQSDKRVSREKIKILIVEDNDELRDFIKHLLQREYDVEVAGDGLNALGVLKESNPNLIISDVMMPDMNGFELCNRVKTNFETSHIPILLLTALVDKKEMLTGLSQGADDYITKPFDSSILLAKIETILRNREAVRQHAVRCIESKGSIPQYSNSQDTLFVKRAIEIAEQNLEDATFDKESFASAMNVSSSLLYKKLKSLTDQSPNNFIRLIRLRKATELLESQQYTITEVSEMTGFSQVGYFSTVYKKFYGKSPSEIIHKV